VNAIRDTLREIIRQVRVAVSMIEERSGEERFGKDELIGKRTTVRAIVVGRAS
jgi:hypothetical protein